MVNVPPTGTVEYDGVKWKFNKHGLGVRFQEDGGKRTIDLHDGRLGADRIDAWRLAIYFGGLGRQGQKLIGRAVGTDSGSLQERLQIWLDDLVKAGKLREDGASYRIL